MRLRYAGRCAGCRRELAAGTVAMYDKDAKTVQCVDCAGVPVVSGQAGGSAAREYQRRHDARENRIRAAHPKLGGLILALSDEPQSTTAWATGARGEQKLAGWLDAAASPSVHPLHDRRIPGGSANIDHLVVTGQGAFVIDAKKYRGQVSKRVEGGFFSPTVERLIVGRRDCTKLVAGVRKQVGTVRTVLDSNDLVGFPVWGMLCFVDAEWGLFSRGFTIDSVNVLWPRRAADHVSRPGTHDDATVTRALRVLAASFPAYT